MKISIKYFLTVSIIILGSFLVQNRLMAEISEADMNQGIGSIKGKETNADKLIRALGKFAASDEDAAVKEACFYGILIGGDKYLSTGNADDIFNEAKTKNPNLKKAIVQKLVVTDKPFKK